MVAVVLGSGIVFLDTSVVNLALPRIGQDLATTHLGTLEAQSYVANGYFVTLSALLVLAGALTDYYGRRRMFATGLAAFGATSLLCGIAPTMEFLIAGRVLQGAAGALLVPGSLSIITANFQGEEQGRAFGIWASASAATTILGPFVGGILVNTISRSCWSPTSRPSGTSGSLGTTRRPATSTGSARSSSRRRSVVWPSARSEASSTDGASRPRS